MIVSKHVPKVISAPKHAVIDYVHAGANVAAGAFFWGRNKRAAAGAFALAAGILANALMTDYPLGVFRLYSFKAHGTLDYGVAAASAAMPDMLGFKGTPEAMYFRAQGSAETGVAAMTDYDDNRGAIRVWGRPSSAEKLLEKALP